MNQRLPGSKLDCWTGTTVGIIKPAKLMFALLIERVSLWLVPIKSRTAVSRVKDTGGTEWTAV
jgi:hypothetical protein